MAVSLVTATEVTLLAASRRINSACVKIVNHHHLLLALLLLATPPLKLSYRQRNPAGILRRLLPSHSRLHVGWKIEIVIQRTFQMTVRSRTKVKGLQRTAESLAV